LLERESWRCSGVFLLRNETTDTYIYSPRTETRVDSRTPGVEKIELINGLIGYPVLVYIVHFKDSISSIVDFQQSLIIVKSADSTEVVFGRDW
jgi:hypothetical protein